MLNRYNRTVSRGTLRGRMLAALAAISLSSVALGASIPPAPKGFETEAEVMAALREGKIKPITPAMFPTDSIDVSNDIEYAKAGDRSLTLDLYRPKEMTKPAPGIVVIHGGAWQGGDKGQLRGYAVHFARRGYVAACISYRLTKEASHPSQVTDAKAAVRWMRANAAQYNIDPDRIVAMGNSAGGHLAMMLGFADAKELEGDYGNTGVSSRVQAVVAFYGPVDLTLEHTRTHKAVVALMGGKTFEEAAEAYKLESPLFSLTKDDPPTLVLHGTIDTTVSVEHSDMLVEKLEALEIPHAYVRLDGWPHAMDMAQPVFEYCTWHIDQFLDAHVPIEK